MLSVQSAELLWYLLRVGPAGRRVRRDAGPARSIRCLVFAVAAVTFPVLIDMNLGNVSVFVTAILAFVWRGLDRPLGSVALAVDMCVRPTLGLRAGLVRAASPLGAGRLDHRGWRR